MQQSKVPTVCLSSSVSSFCTFHTPYGGTTSNPILRKLISCSNSYHPTADEGYSRVPRLKLIFELILHKTHDVKQNRISGYKLEGHATILFGFNSVKFWLNSVR